MIALRDKNIVLIGGGTGNSVLLRSLKNYTENITVIVSVGDDGGSSGRIRKELGTIPPGDIRNCLVALADEENTMAMVMNKRFTEGFMKKQSLGNVILVALYDLTGSFPQAIRLISDVLAIKGRVLPVTIENVALNAKYKNGKNITGESKIATYAIKHKTNVDRIRLVPEDVKLLDECREAIQNADIIIYSPGSLYTSLIPNLLVNGMCEELEKSKAKKIYLANIMTERGETDGFSVSGLVYEIEKHIGNKKIIDTVIYNTQPIPDEILIRYSNEHSFPIKDYIAKEHIKKYEFIGADIVDILSKTVRHDAGALWKILENIL